VENRRTRRTGEDFRARKRRRRFRWQSPRSEADGYRPEPSPMTPARSQNRDRSDSRRNSAVGALVFWNRVGDNLLDFELMGAAGTEHEAWSCLPRFAEPASIQTIGVRISSALDEMRDVRAILVNDWALRPGNLEAQIFRQPFPDLGGKTIMHPPRTDPCHVHHGHRSRSRDRDDKP
jgi:hypothetical protein